jgi:hypothetical protein
MKRPSVRFYAGDELVECFLFQREADLFVRFKGSKEAVTMRLTPHVLQLLSKKSERRVIA